jgi:hypothetical protein
MPLSIMAAAALFLACTYALIGATQLHGRAYPYYLFSLAWAAYAVWDIYRWVTPV